ncbi:MAG TPA: hypothetical protein VHJ20_03050 [Polyangia bacterium]|nr:hypothetical protein [Polyangia bacterium]
MKAKSLLVAVLALAPLACGEATPSSGITAYMRVTGTGVQFAPGALTTDDMAMKPTLALVSRNSHVFPGAQSRSLTGSVGGTATGVLLGLQNDSGHWLVPVGGVPDLDVEGNVTMSATLSFSPDLPFGPQLLIGRAIDADGNVGPARAIALTVDDPNATPKGALFIDLSWDTEADLDLHVHITPDDVGTKRADGTTVAAFDVWAKQPLPLDPSMRSTAAISSAGTFIFDSNARCVIDGQRLERLWFPMANYPVGTYEVRVDTFSLCGEATARWHARAYTNLTGTPQTIVESYGQSIDSDTLGDHNATSGLLALIFASP